MASGCTPCWFWLCGHSCCDRPTNDGRTPVSNQRTVGEKVRREVKRVMIRMGMASPYQPEFFEGFTRRSRHWRSAS